MNSSYTRFIILALLLLFIFRFPLFSFLLIVLPILYILIRGKLVFKHFTTNQTNQNLFEDQKTTWNGSSDNRNTFKDSESDNDFRSRAFSGKSNQTNNEVFEAEYTEREIR